jgi:hypothetical protein
MKITKIQLRKIVRKSLCESSRAGESHDAGYEDGSSGRDPVSNDMDYMAGWETGNEDYEYDIELASKPAPKRKIQEYTRSSMERAYASVVEAYESWSKKMGHVTPAASSVLATYLIDQGLEDDDERTRILASGYKIDKTDLAVELKRQLAERDIVEAEGSTKKYDDDSALKGDQSKLPDGLQKSIIDKTVEDRGEDDKKEKNEGTSLDDMPDAWRQILGNCLGK